MSEQKTPVALDVTKLREHMTQEGYEKFVTVLREIGQRKENTVLMDGDKPVCVFIPAWKVAKAIEGLALE